jgi:hypothetical protein
MDNGLSGSTLQTLILQQILKEPQPFKERMDFFGGIIEANKETHTDCNIFAAALKAKLL